MNDMEKSFGMPGFKRKKSCPFADSRIEEIDYKDVELLSQFITDRGKILPRRITGISHFHQKRVTEAIKRARYMALLPFVSQD